jgi:hypothetical protein
MSFYGRGAYDACIQGVYAAVFMEKEIQKQIEVNLSTDVAKIVLEYYDIIKEYDYASGYKSSDQMIIKDVKTCLGGIGRSKNKES